MSNTRKREKREEEGGQVRKMDEEGRLIVRILHTSVKYTTSRC